MTEEKNKILIENEDFLKKNDRWRKKILLKFKKFLIEENTKLKKKSKKIRTFSGWKKRFFERNKYKKERSYCWKWWTKERNW